MEICNALKNIVIISSTLIRVVVSLNNSASQFCGRFHCGYGPSVGEHGVGHLRINGDPSFPWNHLSCYKERK